MFQVGLNELNLVFISSGLDEIIDALFVDWKECASSAILGTHVGYRCPVGDGQVSNARAEKLDEFSHDALRTQMLMGDGR